MIRGILLLSLVSVGGCDYVDNDNRIAPTPEARSLQPTPTSDEVQTLKFKIKKLINEQRNARELQNELEPLVQNLEDLPKALNGVETKIIGSWRQIYSNQDFDSLQIIFPRGIVWSISGKSLTRSEYTHQGQEFQYTTDRRIELTFTPKGCLTELMLRAESGLYGEGHTADEKTIELAHVFVDSDLRVARSRENNGLYIFERTHLH